jgi:hypothetical protein
VQLNQREVYMLNRSKSIFPLAGAIAGFIHNKREIHMPDGSTPAAQATIHSLTPSERTERAPYVFGLNVSELIEQMSKQLSDARSAIDSADSLTNVAGFALRHQDCDADGDIADVLQDHCYPALSEARDAVVTAAELLVRLKELTAQEVPHG